MALKEWWNRARYELYAPVYDWLAKPWERGRRRAIERLDLRPGARVLIPGSATGGDLAHLPAESRVVATDISPAMVRRTARRARDLPLELEVKVADARSLPSVERDAFDAVLLHLILSVLPENPEAVVDEAARVLKPDGRVSIYDKFIPEPERPSLPRRAMNPVARLVFADLNRSLGPMLSHTDLQLVDREPYMGGLYTIAVARPAAGA